jgi:hypothetical protein
LTRICLLTTIAVAACGRPSGPAPVEHAPLGDTPPALVLGEFQDDYKNRYTISTAEFIHQPGATYRIVKWNQSGRYLIAQNGEDNPSDKGLWTRIDWVQLEGMDPFSWAFCMSAYNAPTAATAEAVTIAQGDKPKTGCNGFPYSRMKRVRSDSGK